MRALVTGGAGFIGSNLIIQLKKLKYDVVSLDNYSTGKKKNEISWKDGKIISAQVWQPDGVQCPESHITDGSGVIVYYKELWDISDRVEVAYRDIIENGNKV